MHIEPSVGAPLQVAVANWIVCTSPGTCKVRLKLQGLVADLTCHVIELVDAYEVILGEDWLSKDSATLSWEHRCCVLTKGSQKITLVPGTDAGHHDGVDPLKPVRLCVDAQSAADASCAAVHGDDVASSTHDKSHLMPETELDALLHEYDDSFMSALPEGLPPERNIGHTIRFEPSSQPPFRHAYRLSPREPAEAKSQIADLIARGHVEPSSSPYSSPILFIQKKDSTLPMCVDYRAPNKLTVKNKYPVPRTVDLLDQLQGSRVFSSLDLTNGYHQIRITPEDVLKTAFSTPFGHYEFKVLSFGLTNAPATFQAVMNDIFRPYIGKVCACVP